MKDSTVVYIIFIRPKCRVVLFTDVLYVDVCKGHSFHAVSYLLNILFSRLCWPLEFKIGYLECPAECTQPLAANHRWRSIAMMELISIRIRKDSEG